MEKMVDGTALKPVRCGCGGEAEVFHVAPEGYAGSYCVRCVKCLTQSPFFTGNKEKAIEVWNRAMGERTAKVKELPRRNETSLDWEGICSNCGAYTNLDMNYCFECGAKLEWE